MEAKLLRPLFEFRHFIFGSVKREIQLQCNGSLFGIIWILLNPLSLTLVYALIFNNLMGARLINHTEKFSYSIYLCAGLLPWNYFASVLTRTVNVFVDNANWLKKCVLPMLCLPLIILLTETVNFLMALFVFSLFLLSIGHFPGFNMLAIIPLLIVQQMFAMGLGIFLACFHVFFRDVGKSIGIILQFWFWLTPIVYVSNILPEFTRHLLTAINPMLPIVNSYQQIMLDGQLPDLYWLVELIPALCVFMLGIATYRRLAPEIVDTV